MGLRARGTVLSGFERLICHTKLVTLRCTKTGPKSVDGNKVMWMICGNCPGVVALQRSREQHVHLGHESLRPCVQ